MLRLKDAPGFAILVLGYARPALLKSVLESLERQGAVGAAHVWIDGTAARAELQADVKGCAEVARGFPVRELRAHRGHYGAGKLILDSLRTLSRDYEQILILEDDCFPTADAIAVFVAELEEVADDESVFSVYGHPFGVEPPSRRFTRFQGWGWATTRRKLSLVLERLEQLFLMDEASYLSFTREALTPEVVARLDLTPPRDVVGVLSSFFSWDSAIALICAQWGLVHRRTERRVIFNCGLTPGHGHFTEKPKFRAPPFSMIAPDEVWDVFDVKGEGALGSP